LLPLLLSSISATRLTIEGVSTNELLGEFQIIISYTVVVVTASYLLFESVWND
jgi:hypothetical protein